MLCLLGLLPGKVGKFVRRYLFPVAAIILLYVVVWILIIKDLNINSIEQHAKGNFVFVTFNVRNDSFAAIEIRDMNIKSVRNEYVERKSRDLPTTIPRYGQKRVVVGFRIDEFKTAEVEIKALLNKYTIKSPLY